MSRWACWWLLLESWTAANYFSVPCACPPPPELAGCRCPIVAASDRPSRASFSIRPA
jgi:hypothetical protein